MKNPGHRKRKQELGELILKLRTEKDLSRGDLIGLCHKRKSELNPDYDYNEVPNETWLARLERGEGAIYTLQQIDLLIAALDATSRQRVETLLVAELPIFAEPNGEVTPEGRLLSIAYSTLMSSQSVRHAVHKYLRTHQDPIASEEQFYLDILQVAVQAGQEDLVRRDRSRPKLPADPSIALSGAE